MAAIRFSAVAGESTGIDPRPVIDLQPGFGGRDREPDTAGGEQAGRLQRRVPSEAEIVVKQPAGHVQHRRLRPVVEPGTGDRFRITERQQAVIDRQVAFSRDGKPMCRQIDRAVQVPVAVVGEIAEGRRIGDRVNVETKRPVIAERIQRPDIEITGKAALPIGMAQDESASMAVIPVEPPVADSGTCTGPVQGRCPLLVLLEIVRSAVDGEPPIRLATGPAIAP